MVYCLTPFRLSAAALAACGALIAAPLAADVKRGVDAWSEGDFDTAVVEWREPAAQGDADALFNLAQAYRLGRGVTADIERARELYAEAAEKGHVKAADNYGLLLFQQGQQSDAMPLIKAASDRGDPRAQYVLGLAHFNADYAGRSEGGDGAGHRKLGAVGRARWENATFAVGTDGRLVDGQPIVMYAGNDRRGGRVWKFVTDAVYTDGMTKAQVRDMLDAGTLYVAHFADLENSDGQTLAGSGGVQADESNRGTGRWIEFSVDSLDSPPNAGALGQPTITVGEALLDVDYNAIGGFPSDDIAKKCLFTAATKLGVRETNRPEDVEYNANDFSGMPRIYIAFTNHTRQVALDQDGVLFDPASHSTDSPNRGDVAGSVMVVEEGNAFNPGASSTFTFWTAYRGQLSTDVGAAAAPDNIAIDSSGGVWFGTDGNFSRNGTADAVYYLDMDPAHRAGEPGVVNATLGQETGSREHLKIAQQYFQLVGGAASECDTIPGR